MKKFLKFASVFLLFSVFVSLSSCQSVSLKDREKKEKPYIVCTVFPQYDFVRNITGDKATVELLIPPGAETHAFGLKDLSVKKIDELYNADLFVCAGGEIDEQLEKELKKMLPQSVRFAELTQFAGELLLESEAENGEDSKKDEVHRSESEEDYDGHVWTSPKRACAIVAKLTDEICETDPNNQAFYRENAREYLSQLEELDRLLEDTVSGAKFRTLIFADRFPFRYLCHDYGIEADAAFEGCSTAVEPSLMTLNRLYEKAMDLRLPAILYTETGDRSYAENLAQKIGGKALLLHSCHEISAKEFQTATYLSMQRQNIETLKVALGSGE